MLGLIGFFTLALVISLYIYTCHRNYTLVPIREKRLFVAGYGLLAVAAVIWAAAFLVAGAAVPAMVFMSDIVLVVATGCMVGVVFDIAKLRTLIPVVIIGSWLLTIRAFTAPSTAYIADNLLVFNLSPVQATVIGLIFLFAWLPATIKIVYLALRSPRLLAFRNLMAFLFISVVLMTGFFLTARRPVMIIISFVSIILLFGVLTGVNIILKRIDTDHGKRRA